MTFHFLVFTITIKKRSYTEEELQQLIRQEKINQEISDRLSKIDFYR
ncbi:YrzI family small protein [Alkalihalobacillus sp. 1P02AB]